MERMVAAVPPGQGLAVIGLYTVIYCLPCLILLLAGLVSRKRTRALLERIRTRLGTGAVNRSVPVALLLIALGLLVASIPFWIEMVL